MKNFQHPTFSPKKQHGSLLLGFVFGLIIGLTIAVIVAFYIKRGPTPFITDVPTIRDENQIDENRTTDINRLLTGTQDDEANQSREKETSSIQTQPNEPEDPQVLEMTDDEITKILEEKQITNPIKQQKNRNNSITQSTASFAKQDSNIVFSSKKTLSQPPVQMEYFLQIGAFKQKEDAEKLRAEIAFTGREVSIIHNGEHDGFYRVRLGPFDAKNLQIQQEYLEEAQIKYIVIRISKKL